MNSRFITDSAKAFDELVELRQAPTEEFWVLALSASKKLTAKKMIFRGTVENCDIHPREIFHFAISQLASSVLVAHNHPSQDEKPSLGDLEATQRLLRVSRLIGIPMVDHIIVTKSSWWSFKDAGQLKIGRGP